MQSVGTGYLAYSTAQEFSERLAGLFLLPGGSHRGVVGRRLDMARHLAVGTRHVSDNSATTASMHACIRRQGPATYGLFSSPILTIDAHRSTRDVPMVHMRCSRCSTTMGAPADVMLVSFGNMMSWPPICNDSSR